MVANHGAIFERKCAECISARGYLTEEATNAQIHEELRNLRYPIDNYK